MESKKQSFHFLPAREREIAKLLNKTRIHLDGKKILDVGCGTGGVLRGFVEMGADPENCFGTDILEYRIEKAKAKNPAINYAMTDGKTLPFADESFDIIIQTTAFSSMENKEARIQNAKEIERVLKSGGMLIWYDMKRNLRNLWSSFPAPISKTDLISYFPEMEIIYDKPMHFVAVSPIAKISPFLAKVTEIFPSILKSHILAGFRKKQ